MIISIGEYNRSFLLADIQEKGPVVETTSPVYLLTHLNLPLNYK